MIVQVINLILNLPYFVVAKVFSAIVDHSLRIYHRRLVRYISPLPRCKQYYLDNSIRQCQGSGCPIVACIDRMRCNRLDGDGIRLGKRKDLDLQMLAGTMNFPSMVVEALPFRWQWSSFDQSSSEWQLLCLAAVSWLKLVWSLFAPLSLEW